MQDFKGCVVLITGGAGFIGHQLVKKLLEEGPKQLIIVDDLSSGQIENIENYLGLATVQFIHSKIENLKSEDLPNQVDYIFHLAAIVSVPYSIENAFLSHSVNEQGFLNILEISTLKDTRKVLFASSSAVYGESVNVPTSEETKLCPLSPYAFSKYINELHAQSYAQLKKVSFLGFRFFNVYGSGQKADSSYSGVISLFLNKLKNNEPITIFGDGNQVRDFVHVSDVVHSLMKGALSNRNNQIYNIGTGEGATVNSLLATLQQLLNTKITPIFEAERAGDIKKSVANIDKLVDEIGFQPTITMKEGLAKLISENAF